MTKQWQFPCVYHPCWLIFSFFIPRIQCSKLCRRQGSVLHFYVQLSGFFCHEKFSNFWNELWNFNHPFLRHLGMTPLYLIFLSLPPRNKAHKEIISTGVWEGWMYHFAHADELFFLVPETQSTVSFLFHRNCSALVDRFSDRSKFKGILILLKCFKAINKGTVLCLLR